MSRYLALAPAMVRNGPMFVILAAIATWYFSKKIIFTSVFTVREAVTIVWRYLVVSRNFRNTIIAGVVMAYGLSRGTRMVTTVFRRWTLVAWSISCVGLFNYYNNIIETPVVRCKRTPWNVQIIQKAKLTTTDYWPIFFGWNKHMQTALLPMISDLEFLWKSPLAWREEVLTAKDGLDVHLHWGIPSNTKQREQLVEDSPVILLIHGLAGGVNSNYVARMARQSTLAGWRTAALAYYRLDWGDPQDIAACVNRIHEKFPSAPIVAIAYSAGAHPLTRYIETEGDHCLLTAAITNGGVYNFSHVYDRVSKGPYHPIINRWIQTCGQRHVDRYLTEQEKAIAVPKFDQFKKAMHFYTHFIHGLRSCTSTSLDGVLSYRSYADRDYPDNVSPDEAEMEGGVVGEHFRGHASLWMHTIKTPLLMIHSKDDPVVAYTNQDWHSSANNEHIISVTTKRGGHVAFFQGLLPFGPTWSETIQMQYIASVLEINATLSFQLDAVSKLLMTHPELTPQQQSVAADEATVDWHENESAPFKTGGEKLEKRSSESPARGRSRSRRGLHGRAGSSHRLTAPEVSRIASMSIEDLPALVREGPI